MPNSSSPQLHASVLQFLMNHGYMESVEAFKREARRHLDTLPSLQVSDDQLVNDLSQLQIQRYKKKGFNPPSPYSLYILDQMNSLMAMAIILPRWYPSFQISIIPTF